jgi:hypothetical protein
MNYSKTLCHEFILDRMSLKTALFYEKTFIYDFLQHLDMYNSLIKEYYEKNKERLREFYCNSLFIILMIPKSDAKSERIQRRDEIVIGMNLKPLISRIDKLENSMLTKWDVAKVIFEIIGFMLALVVVVLAIATLLLS